MMQLGVSFTHRFYALTSAVLPPERDRAGSLQQKKRAPYPFHYVVFICFSERLRRGVPRDYVFSADKVSSIRFQ